MVKKIKGPVYNMVDEEKISEREARLIEFVGQAMMTLVDCAAGLRYEDPKLVNEVIQPLLNEFGKWEGKEYYDTDRYEEYFNLSNDAKRRIILNE